MELILIFLSILVALFTTRVGHAILLVALVIWAGASMAQNCGPREIVVDRLTDRYGETRKAIGLTSDGNLFEVFASDDTGTWTVVITTVNGLTCPAVMGRAYDTQPAPLTPPGDDG